MLKMVKKLKEKIIVIGFTGIKGQGMVEYALIIALVAILLVSGLMLMKDQIVAVFTSITDSLKGNATP